MRFPKGFVLFQYKLKMSKNGKKIHRKGVAREKEARDFNRGKN